MKRMIYVLILFGILISINSVLAQDEDEGGSGDAPVKSTIIDTSIFRQEVSPSAGNSIYQVFVDEVANVGAYTASTGSEHPITRLTGTRENILFGGTSATPSTSYNSVRSYSSGTDYVPIATANSSEGFALFSLNPLVNPAIAPFITTETIGNTGHRTTYALPGAPITPDSMTIVQEINVVGTTLADTRVQVSMSITNTGTSTLSIGVRYLWDFSIQNDDDPIYVPMAGVARPTTEIAYAPPPFGAYRVQSERFPNVILNATVSTPASLNPTAPDVLQIVQWAQAFGQAFDVLIDPTADIINIDNAVTYFFGATADSALSIPPGQTVSVQQAFYVTAPSLNLPPVANDDNYQVVGDMNSLLNVRENDFDLDLDMLTITQFSATTSGAILQITPDGQINYSPPPAFTGEDTFTYIISDGRGGTDTATVQLTVVPPNQPPVANNDTVSVPSDETTAIDVLANDTDPENDPIIVDIVQTTAQGAGVVIDFPSYDILYTPPAGFIGEDSFLYTIVDTNGLTDTALVNVTVFDSNNAPVANNDTTGTIENQPVVINVLANDSDVDNDPLTVTQLLNVTGGTAVINGDNTVTFTPNAGFIGTINPAFTYVISDGGTGTAQATVTVNVSPSNNPPTANNDFASTTINMPVDINVLMNDTDPNGDQLTVAGVSVPSSGTASVNPAGTVRYTPANGFMGTATFEYTLSDSNGATDTAVVTVTVSSTVCTPDNPNYNPAGDLNHEGSLLLRETNFTTGRIVNRSQLCRYAVGIASYQMFDDVIDNQVLFDYQEVFIEPGQTLDLTVAIPDCAHQIDLFYGNVLLSLNGQRYGQRLLDARVNLTPGFCTIEPSQNP